MNDFIPCCRFDEWHFQAVAVLGAAAAEIHYAAVSTGDTAGANEKLSEMIPAVDGIAAEFRLLLGRAARPDIAPE